MAPKKQFVNTGFMEFVEDTVQTRIAEMPWMADRTFKLAKSMEEVENYIDRAIEAKRCALDLETTGLNTRVKKVDGKIVPIGKIVGFALCYDPKVAIYIPINHREGIEFNLPEEAVLKEIKRLCYNCITIYHNAKFDLTYLKNYGIVLDNHNQFEDTLLLAYLHDSGRKANKLKDLSPELLDQPMLKFNEVAKEGHFDLVSPDVGYTYGASDAMCTMDLYIFFTEQEIIKSQQMIYNLEKRVVFVMMDMEANLIKIDVPYLKDLKTKVENRIEDIKKEIHQLVGYEFNLGSSQKLGKILFDDLKYKYPEKTKTKSGQYSTDSKTLNKIADLYPIVKKIINFRGLEKVLSTYINNLLNNHDEEGFVKLQFKQTGTDTGRFSSPGGQGIHIDGSSGVNVQSIPKMPSEDNPDIDMRRAFIARPGKTMVAIDYANEEMRVATNISNETAWIESIHKGIDFHTATGAIISGKDPKDVLKSERKIGKTVNFLALYLGGPFTLAGNAKITVPEAKKILATFFAGVPKLKKWIDRVIVVARKEKFVKTIFGRTRPLNKYYDSGDKGLAAHADRCAVNTKIQGCLCQEERCLTTEGYLSIIKIKKLKESGQNLKIWTGVSWEDFEVLDRGEAQLAIIELKNGMILHCDTRHEVLTVNNERYEFKKFNELTEDTNICISRPQLLKFGSYPEEIIFEGNVWNAQKLKVSTAEEWDFIAYLLGCVIGDGSIYIDKKASKYVITLNFGEEKIRRIFPDLKRKLNDLGLNISEPVLNKGSKGICYKTSICSVTLTKLFGEMGYHFHDARDKRIPQRIMESPIKMRQSFLRGYFDTDGCKKEANKYGFHTPNKDLLRDIQLLAWTLGCPSTIYDCGDGSSIFNWMNYRIFAELMDLTYKKEERKCNTQNMPLPDFLREPILNSLGNCYVKNGNDRSYVCKVRKGKNVSLPGIVSLLESYNCELPEIYYHSKLEKKRVLSKKEVTYTLSVKSPLHRFDSAGIISKNTSADIMKAVMARMNSWLTRNNLHDDIKILITMHDELVFEITTEKLQILVPEICKIMQLNDIIQGQLKWPIPLEVDIQYGDTWRVKGDFLKDFPDLRNKLSEPLMEFESLQKIKDDVPKDKNDEPPVESNKIEEENSEKDSNEVPDNQIIEEKTPSEIQDIEKSEQHDVPKDKEVLEKVDSGTVDSSKISEKKTLNGGDISGQYLIYTLRELSTISSRWLNDILVFLNDEGNRYEEKDKKILKIRDRSGNSLLVSEYKVHPESFSLLARFFGI